MLLNNPDQISGCFNKNGEYLGFFPHIFKALSQYGNFQMDFSYLDVSGSRRETPTFFTFIAHYAVGLYRKIHMTSTFSEVKQGFIIPLSESYSTYEKLYLPFDEMIWICLIITFGSTFGLIFVLKRYAPFWMQFRIFGARIQSPAFNVLGQFFGIAQNRLPVENFARFLLITYVMAFLVIRTAYQGVFFEMFTHDMRNTAEDNR
jgi:hypothetical protein